MDNKPANRGRLCDKVAIVTGGASGIGEGICLEFASQGAAIAIADINGQRATAVTGKIRDLGSEAIALEADVSDHQKVTGAVAQVLQRFGTIDILVNCAGWNTFMAPHEIPMELWTKLRSVNLDGQWYMCRAVMPEMMKKRNGKIINIGSGASLLGIPKAVPYTATKHAIVGLTRALAIDLGPYNINVNCICPGTILTPLVKEAVTPLFLEKTLGHYPLGRLGKPSDIAKAALFLASSDSDWVTGVALPVDGGITCCIRAHHDE